MHMGRSKKEHFRRFQKIKDLANKEKKLDGFTHFPVATITSLSVLSLLLAHSEQQHQQQQ